MYKLILVITLICILSGCSVFGGKASQEPITSDKTTLPITTQAEKSVSWMPAVVGVCVVIIGVSVALLVAGNKLGIAGLAGAGTSMVVAITVSQWLWLIAAIGGLIALGLAGLLIWRIWTSRKALSEVVWTAEEAKKLLTETTRQMLFGGVSDSGTAGEMQSPATEKLVAKIRAKSE